MLTSNAKGMRNLTDAASQRPYRTWARCFLNTKLKSPAVAANRVDCHRWLARGVRFAGIILICPASKESQQFVYQLPLRFAAGNGRLEYVRVADPFDTAHRFLGLQPIDGGLHGGVGRPASFRKCFLNFANGASAAVPQGLHD